MSDLDEVLASSRALRLEQMGLKVDGDQFDLSLYPFLIRMIDRMGCDRKIVVRKGGQLGFTAAAVLGCIDLAANVYHRGILYLMPTQDDVSDFSKARFQRMLDENPLLAQHVGGESLGIRRIGKTFVYFRGSRSRSRLKSIPVDLLVTDERDEMEDSQIALAEKRLDGSDFKHEMEFSTPTIPDFGVDLRYKESTQSTWHIKCEHCGAWTCLEDAWPESLLRRSDNSVFRACSKCRKEIYVINGEWVDANPGHDRIGLYVSQLCSPKVQPLQILNEWEDPNTDQQEFYNHRLGLAYADLEDALTEPLLKAACSPDPMESASMGPSILGADIGKKTIHWMVGTRVSDKLIRTSSYGICDGFEELHDVGVRHNVAIGVLDEMAETRSVREFSERHSWAYGCWYSEEQRTGYDWNDVDRRVSVNRTELLDHSHRMIIRKEATFPRPGSEWAVFVKQMTNLARKRYRDLDETGRQKVRWIVRGGRKFDHFRHAFAYMVLASLIAPLAKRSRRIMTPAEARSGGTWMGG